MTKVTAPIVSHEDMGHSGMEHAGMEHAGMEHSGIEHSGTTHDPDSNQNADALTLRPASGPCSHCAMHSRTTSNAVSLREREAAQRLGDQLTLHSSSSVAPVISSSFAVLSSRAHGPPGDNIPRHILINIFRI